MEKLKITERNMRNRLCVYKEKTENISAGTPAYFVRKTEIE